MARCTTRRTSATLGETAARARGALGLGVPARAGAVSSRRAGLGLRAVAVAAGIVAGTTAGTPPTEAAARPARPARHPLGSLTLETWDAQKDVFFETITLWRQGCDLRYRFTYRRRLGHRLRIRALVSLDAGPAETATGWAVSTKAGAQTAEGAVPTPGCWVRKARGIKRVRFEAAGEPQPRPDAQGRRYLGRVTFNRWGASGDVYYRHIRAHARGCRIDYQFLYKRRNAIRRRLRMRLTFDNGELQTRWYRSKTKGWREIVGSAETPGCWAAKSRGLRSAAFESERY